MTLILAHPLGMKKFLSDPTNISHFTAAPVPGMNNRRQTIVFVECHLYTPIPSCLCPSTAHIADINQNQCLLPTNLSCGNEISGPIPPAALMNDTAHYITSISNIFDMLTPLFIALVT